MSYMHWIVVLLNLSAWARIVGNILVLGWGGLLFYSGIIHLKATLKTYVMKLNYRKQLMDESIRAFKEENRIRFGKEPWQE